VPALLFAWAAGLDCSPGAPVLPGLLYPVCWRGFWRAVVAVKGL